MVAFLVKWLGVLVLTIIAYSVCVNYISRGSFHLGQATISYAFVCALVAFILGAKVTAKSK